MPLDLFAGIYVSDYEAAKPWYVRLLGSEPAFNATDTESVWELAEHRWLYIKENGQRSGHAEHAIMIDDLVGRVADIAEHGIEPVRWERYGDARKAVYRDLDGNEVAFGVIPG
jgi:hypothetical protein